MPRTARASAGGICYHVLNRGNGRMRVYHTDRDYQAFIKMMKQACNRLPMRIPAFCLMPNHFHLVLWPYEDGDLSNWMQWLLTTHVRRYHRMYGTSGHVWQGRFKAFPIQQDEHLFVVMRYVERNVLSAQLVTSAEDWHWSSMQATTNTKPGDGPIERPANWSKFVNDEPGTDEINALQNCIQRGAPYGDEHWVNDTASRLDLQSSTRPRGRPRKRQESEK